MLRKIVPRRRSVEQESLFKLYNKTQKKGSDWKKNNKAMKIFKAFVKQKVIHKKTEEGAIGIKEASVEDTLIREINKKVGKPKYSFTFHDSNKKNKTKSKKALNVNQNELLTNESNTNVNACQENDNANKAEKTGEKAEKTSEKTDKTEKTSEKFDLMKLINAQDEYNKANRNIDVIIFCLKQFSKFMQFVKFNNITYDNLRTIAPYITYEFYPKNSAIYTANKKLTKLYGVIKGQVSVKTIDLEKANEVKRQNEMNGIFEEQKMKLLFHKNRNSISGNPKSQYYRQEFEDKDFVKNYNEYLRDTMIKNNLQRGYNRKNTMNNNIYNSAGYYNNITYNSYTKGKSNFEKNAFGNLQEDSRYENVFNINMINNNNQAFSMGKKDNNQNYYSNHLLSFMNENRYYINNNNSNNDYSYNNDFLIRSNVKYPKTNVNENAKYQKYKSTVEEMINDYNENTDLYPKRDGNRLSKDILINLKLVYGYEIARYTKGTVFGEWDLLFNRNTTESTFATEDTHLFVLEKEYFDKYLWPILNKAELERKIFISKKIPILKIEHMGYLKPEFYENNQIIYTEYDRATSAYLIYSGSGVIKKIHNADNKIDIFNMKDQAKVITIIDKGGLVGLECGKDEKNPYYDNTFISNNEFTVIYKLDMNKLLSKRQFLLHKRLYKFFNRLYNQQNLLIQKYSYLHNINLTDKILKDKKINENEVLYYKTLGILFGFKDKKRLGIDFPDKWNDDFNLRRIVKIGTIILDSDRSKSKDDDNISYSKRESDRNQKFNPINLINNKIVIKDPSVINNKNEEYKNFFNVKECYNKNDSNDFDLTDDFIFKNKALRDYLTGQKKVNNEFYENKKNLKLNIKSYSTLKSVDLNKFNTNTNSITYNNTISSNNNFLKNGKKNVESRNIKSMFHLLYQNSNTCGNEDTENMKGKHKPFVSAFQKDNKNKNKSYDEMIKLLKLLNNNDPNYKYDSGYIKIPLLNNAYKESKNNKS